MISIYKGNGGTLGRNINQGVPKLFTEQRTIDSLSGISNESQCILEVLEISKLRKINFDLSPGFKAPWIARIQSISFESSNQEPIAVCLVKSTPFHGM